MSHADLPPLQARFLRRAGPAGRDRLIEVQTGARAPAAAAGTGSSPGEGNYELRTLAPPQTLQELARAGARFHLSRLGNVRVWLAGTLHAAATEADCLLDNGRRLAADEIEYLSAYLACIGRKWNDVDQPCHADEPA